MSKKVVIVGSGNAALSAGIAALEKGAEVIIYEKEQPRNSNNKLIVLAGLVVSAVDITNSTSFAAGALIAIIANFL